MPEMIEVEYYRRLAERARGRAIAAVRAEDPWFLKAGLTAAAVAAALEGGRIVAARRRGKLLLCDIEPARVVLGLRFGMTGRLVVDGAAGVEELIYSPDRDDPRWDRFSLQFADGGALVVRDPRRLGGVLLDPDVGRLGPDAATLTLRQLRQAMAGSEAPVKARLMDQARVAGIGNLLADEILWRARLHPARPVGGLADGEARRLLRHVRGTVAELTERGGSHTGDLMEHRRPGGTCPRCGTALARTAVGGRTTWSCPRHQPAVINVGDGRARE